MSWPDLRMLIGRKVAISMATKWLWLLHVTVHVIFDSHDSGSSFAVCDRRVGLKRGFERHVLRNAPACVSLPVCQSCSYSESGARQVEEVVARYRGGGEGSRLLSCFLANPLVAEFADEVRFNLYRAWSIARVC